MSRENELAESVPSPYLIERARDTRLRSQRYHMSDLGPKPDFSKNAQGFIYRRHIAGCLSGSVD